MTWPGLKPGTSRKYNDQQSYKVNRCDSFHHQVFMPALHEVYLCERSLRQKKITCNAMTWPGLEPGTPIKSKTFQQEGEWV
jgi:hypothetical protein